MASRMMVILLITLGFFSISTGFVVDVFNPGPPSPFQPARMARYIMQYSDWVSVGTISTLPNITGFPFVSLKSVSDGPPGNSTGIPYLYLTDMDVSGHDLNIDSRSTIMVSLAESDYCKEENFDPQDPRCAKLILTGRIIKIDTATPEYQFGLNSLYTKHPAMKSWPKEHKFYVSKMNIEQICVLDYFGGLKYVSLEDYFARDLDWEIREVDVIDVAAN